MKTLEERIELLEAQLDGSKLRARIAELESEVERLSFHENEQLRLKSELGMPDRVIVSQYAINAVKDLRKLIAVLLPDEKRMPGTEDSWLDQMVHEDKHLEARWAAQRLVERQGKLDRSMRVVEAAKAAIGNVDAVSGEEHLQDLSDAIEVWEAGR